MRVNISYFAEKRNGLETSSDVSKEHTSPDFTFHIFDQLHDWISIISISKVVDNLHGADVGANNAGQESD